MQVPDRGALRRAGVIGTVGGALTAGFGLLVVAVVRPASDVPDDRWSAPWSSTALVPVSIVYAALHLLVLVGVLGVARSGVAGTGRATRTGTAVATAGLVAFAVAELASIPVRDRRLDDTGAVVVGTLFGVATVLTAVGMLVLGVATVRAHRWHGWRRAVPLATGVWLLVLSVLAMTPALAAGVTVYGLLAAALGVALVTRPGPVEERRGARADTIEV
jgi:hypothetical protein